MEKSPRLRQINKNGEIDLTESYMQLWYSKGWILICALIFSISAYIYTLSIQPWWVSSIIITKGQYNDSNLLNEKLIKLSVALTNKDNKSINTLISENNLLDDFIYEYNSYQNKKDFLKLYFSSRDFGKQKTKNKKQLAILESKFESFKKEDGYKLIFHGHTSKQSSDLLKVYIDYTDRNVYKNTIEKLNSIIINNKQHLEKDLYFLKQEAKNKLEIEIKKTKYSIEIAKAVNKQKLILSSGDDDLFPITLGVQGLQEKYKILKETNELSILVPEISIVEDNIKILRKVNLSNKMDFSSIHIVDGKEPSVIKEKSKSIFIITLGFILGLMFSVVVILLHFIFNKK